MISTVGGALATGGGILISRRYGAKDIDGAKDVQILYLV